MSTELTLMVVIWVLYLHDAARLLESNQAVLQAKRRGWVALFGSHRWKIRGKEPYLPNPFTPYRPSYVLAWRFIATTASVLGADTPATADAVQRLHNAPLAIRRFGIYVTLSAIGLLVLVPLGLFTQLGHPALIVAVLCIYASNIAAIVHLLLRRKQLGLAKGKSAVLVVECLFCPPFALNLVRKLSALQAVQADFENAAHSLISAIQWAEVQTQCLLRMDEQLAYAEENSPYMAALLDARARFVRAEESE